MGLTYFKRFRMEIRDLLGTRLFPGRARRSGYLCIAEWNESLSEAHAEAKYHSFRGEIDSNVFPCLGELSGCIRLMHEIRHKEGFLPGATWLVRYHRPTSFIRPRSNLRSSYIQNLAARSKASAITREWARSKTWGSLQSIARTGLGTRGSCTKPCMDFRRALDCNEPSWKSLPRIMEPFGCISESVFPKRARCTRPSRSRTR